MEVWRPLLYDSVYQHWTRDLGCAFDNRHRYLCTLHGVHVCNVLESGQLSEESTGNYHLPTRQKSCPSFIRWLSTKPSLDRLYSVGCAQSFPYEPVSAVSNILYLSASVFVRFCFCPLGILLWNLLRISETGLFKQEEFYQMPSPTAAFTPLKPEIDKYFLSQR